FEINKTKKFVEVSVNPDLEYIINGLTAEFSRFELSAFTSLRSTYAKTLFRLLMQYRSTGYYVVRIEEFRSLMDIPEYYQMGNIDQKVL
ncbi:replication initiation protein, partial [Enterococcus faecalis]